MRQLTAIACITAVAANVAACGGSERGGSDEETLAVDQDQAAAADPSRAEFPAAKGKTMREVGESADARSGPELVPATSRYVVGSNRLAFGILGGGGQLLYAPTAVYVARSPDGPATGPYLAPADSLITEPAFRSKQAALEGDAIASIYSAEIPIERAGVHWILVLTATDQGMLGATGQIRAAAGDPIPAPGEQAPSVETETRETTVAELLETRDPPDTMHEANFADVLGERPIALLFASPSLCESRVCGPVTDVAAELQAEYGDRVEFVHQEPYVDNDLTKGLRTPLRAFNLQTEPWLFTIDRNSRVAARLEGSFGKASFERALRSALGEA